MARYMDDDAMSDGLTLTNWYSCSVHSLMYRASVCVSMLASAAYTRTCHYNTSHTHTHTHIHAHTHIHTQLTLASRLINR